MTSTSKANAKLKLSINKRKYNSWGQAFDFKWLRSNLKWQSINQYVSLSLDNNTKQIIYQDKCLFAFINQTSNIFSKQPLRISLLTI